MIRTFLATAGTAVLLHLRVSATEAASGGADAETRITQSVEKVVGDSGHPVTSRAARRTGFSERGCQGGSRP